MQALRSHPFFSSINWETLWTEPPPLIESGLVKRQHPLANGHDQNWDDVGAAWDDLVGSDGSDEVGWASNADAPDYEQRPNGYINGDVNSTIMTADQLVDIGPMGEIRRPMPVRRETESTLRDVVFPPPHPEAAGPSRLRESPVTGSPTSSSEGSPVEILSQRMEALLPPSTERTSPDVINGMVQTEEERGRNKSMSPVQGNGLPSDVD